MQRPPASTRSCEAAHALLNLYESDAEHAAHHLVGSRPCTQALPGYPAFMVVSAFRMGLKKLFGMTAMGTRVIVSRDPVTPVPIAHERLFTAFPPEDGELATGSTAPRETQVADASGASPGMLSMAAAADEPARPSYRERRRIESEKLNAEIRRRLRQGGEADLSHAGAEGGCPGKPHIEARAEADRLN